MVRVTDELKIWIAVRRDLNMPAGKLAAQVGHGVANAIWYGPQATVAAYMETSQAKIVVGVKDEADLFAVDREAQSAGLPTYFICDRGRTVFKEPTYTVAAIGPTTREALPSRIKRLRLLTDE